MPVVLVLLLAAGKSYSQACISGRIIDSKSEAAISGASVTVKGNGATITDAKGEFRICNLKQDSVTLYISHISYEKVSLGYKLNKGENKFKDIVLTPALLNMDEVVITATRTDNRVIDAPGRVNLLTFKQLESIPVQN
ncbi:MAG TPA: carboxypeptidase-like regulatory domain-containing protein, partial [Bacteroidales bacterium]|nr:carboxypeptidase-like regulatory domain-containing protein [Bacteroidales bacterium]